MLRQFALQGLLGQQGFVGCATVHAKHRRSHCICTRENGFRRCHRHQSCADLLCAAAPTKGHATSAAPEPAQKLLTLERSVGGAQRMDAALLQTGVFGAEVFPDLPIATTWLGLGKALLK
jgi:hypothetical protein